MKIINDLVICEIPKDSTNHEIKTIGDGQYCQWQIGKAHGVDKLPSGYEYEVICKLSEVEDKTDEVLLIGNLAQINSPIRYQDYFLLWFDTYNPTTDLLFLKRITNQKK